MNSMDNTNIMDHHHTSAPMDPMPMTFSSSTTTPLFSTAWKPSTASQYALTCIFLVLLCIVFRCLLAARCNLPTLLARQTRKEEAAKRLSACCAEDEGGELYDKPEHEHGVAGRERRSRKDCAWAGEVALRAVLDTLLALVSYLL
ncbi:hypothetical protein Q7P37_004335 [Cladosporium fusiforme]